MGMDGSKKQCGLLQRFDDLTLLEDIPRWRRNTDSHAAVSRGRDGVRVRGRRRCKSASGRNFVRRATHADLEFAKQMFEYAISRNLPSPTPDSRMYARSSTIGTNPMNAGLKRGLSAANSSLNFEPELAEGLAARARIFWAQRKHEDAIQHARLAIE